MVTGELKTQIDRIWDSFWSGGISNPLEVIEQITFLLFIKRLDELQTLAENKAKTLGEPIERTIFPEGRDGIAHPDHPGGRDYADYRWSRFKHFAPAEMYEVVKEHVFPFLGTVGGEGTTYETHMAGARFTIPTPALLAKAVDGLDAVPMVDRDTKGDVYEYMLAKIATAGQNGQFRTSRHIIEVMVAMADPKPGDVICDPACGTAGFLIAASEHVRNKYPEVLRDPKLNRQFHEQMFNGFDFDNTMLRIGSMNMLLHGVEQPNIRYKDSLAQEHSTDEEAYSLILANPPFSGSLDYENTAKDLQQIVKTKKTELLFLALFIKLLKPGGRAAVIVPDGVLYGDTKAHKELRRILVEDQKLEGVISLPSGAFKPYTGVSTAVLLFTKTNSGGTDNVWFYDLIADGYSLDDRREPLLSGDLLGVRPCRELSEDEHRRNNLPDAVQRWWQRHGSELGRDRSQQSFCVPASELKDNGFDLNIRTYRASSRDVSADGEDSSLLRGQLPAWSDSVNAATSFVVGPLTPLADATETVALGDIVDFVGGGTPSRSRPDYFAGDICWATSKDIKSDYLDDTLEHITEEGIRDSATKLVPVGTVLIVVKSKILARTLPVAVSNVPTCFGQDLKGLIAHEGWLPEYIAAVLRGGAPTLLCRARGANTEGLTLKHLRAVRVPVRPLDDQVAIVADLLALHDLRRTYQEGAQHLNLLLETRRRELYRGSL